MHNINNTQYNMSTKRDRAVLLSQCRDNEEKGKHQKRGKLDQPGGGNTTGVLAIATD